MRGIDENAGVSGNNAERVDISGETSKEERTRWQMVSGDRAVTASPKTFARIAPTFIGRSRTRAEGVASHYRGLGEQLVGSSVAESSQRKYVIFQSWCVFRTLMGLEIYLRGEETRDEMAWALIDFAAWYSEKHGNISSTISGKFAAEQYFHQVHKTSGFL